VLIVQKGGLKVSKLCPRKHQKVEAPYTRHGKGVIGHRKMSHHTNR
jgi:hypothetical protein